VGDPASRFDGTLDSLEAALAVVGRTPLILRGLLDGLEPPLVGSRSEPNWGPRQVLEHLLDVEGIAFADRIARIVHEERPFIRSIDPSGRLRDGDYGRRSLDGLIDELIRRRVEDVAWLRSLNPAQLDREGEHDRAGTFTARQLVHYWACHDLLHLRQLARGLQEALTPFVGNLSTFFEEGCTRLDGSIRGRRQRRVAMNQLEDVDVLLKVPRRRFVEGVWIEPSPRRVRAWFGGVAVGDSERVLLVYEPKRLPVYWFPVADVRMDLLRPSTRPAGHADGEAARPARFDVHVGDRVAEKAAWTYPEPDPDRVALKDHVAFYWNQMDAWFEEDDEVFVHPRDPYHRVDVLHSSRRVRIEVGGQVVAESSRPCLLFETGLPTRYYLPKLDVRMDLLVPSHTTSRCPYKGVAVYWSLRSGDGLLEDLVWSYPSPIPECPKIESLLCFYNERVDLSVNGELQVRPVSPWS